MHAVEEVMRITVVVAAIVAGTVMALWAAWSASMDDPDLTGEGHIVLG
jgi:hypothetical protein